MGELEVFGRRSLRLSLGIACLGLGAIAAARALGLAEPLAAWASGLAAVPLGDSLGIALAAVLLVIGAVLLAGRVVAVAGALLAALLGASLLLNPPTTLGAIQDVGLLGAAIGLLALPADRAARLPGPLARLLDPAHPAPRWLLVRLGLAVMFLLAGWGKFADRAWYDGLLTASGGLAGWPLLGGMNSTALLLWLGLLELFLGALIVWGPPARLASATATLLLTLELLALHTPALIAVKTLGLVGAAIAGYCGIHAATALENATIPWLRPTPHPDSTDEHDRRPSTASSDY